MTAPIGVYAAPDAQISTAAVLSSLPLSYAPATTAAGNLTVVDGTSDWTGAVASALDDGAAAVIVTQPEPTDPGPLLTRAGPVALDRRWAANPVVESAAEHFAAALPTAGRLECTVYQPVSTATATALLDQIGLIRALVGPVTDLRILTRSIHGYAAEGTTAEHPVDLTLVCTDAVPERASVRLLTHDGSVDLTIPSGDTAQPARLTVTGPGGTTLSPTLYETGHRATWRRVHTLLDHRTPTRDLEDFASDWKTVTTALPHVEG